MASPCDCTCRRSRKAPAKPKKLPSAAHLWVQKPPQLPSVAHLRHQPARSWTVGGFGSRERQELNVGSHSLNQPAVWGQSRAAHRSPPKSSLDPSVRNIGSSTPADSPLTPLGWTSGCGSQKPRPTHAAIACSWIVSGISTDGPNLRCTQVKNRKYPRLCVGVPQLRSGISRSSKVKK